MSDIEMKTKCGEKKHSTIDKVMFLSAVCCLSFLKEKDEP